MATPMHPSMVIDEDEKGNDTSKNKYRGMIGSLLYLIASRPDIVFVVCLCEKFQSCPKICHVTEIKRILRYHIGTSNHGL